MMGPGSLAAGSAKLADAVETLQEAWREASEEWDDATAKNFEENHLRPLIRECGAALETTAQLREVLLKAYRECEAERDY